MAISPSRRGGTSKAVLGVLIVGFILTMAVLGLSIAVWILVINGFRSQHDAFDGGSMTGTVSTTIAAQSPTLVPSININDVLSHLKEF